MALSHKMLAVLKKADAANAELHAILHERARLEAEARTKKTAKERRDADHHAAIARGKKRGEDDMTENQKPGQEPEPASQPPKRKPISPYGKVLNRRGAKSKYRIVRKPGR